MRRLALGQSWGMNVRQRITLRNMDIRTAMNQRSSRSWLHVLGIGALVTGGATVVLWLLAVALFIGPLVFWFAWNVLKFGQAIGLPALGFWAIILASVFLAMGWFGKVAIAAFVFLIDPSWLGGTATVRWPEPTFRNLLAIMLLSILAARPRSRAHKTVDG
jgi:hypothetical protein